MRIICGDCGADAVAGVCPRCDGPVFDVDTPAGREQVGHYRAIRVDRRTQGPIAFIIIFGVLVMPFGLEKMMQTWIADALLRPADTAPLCLLLVFGSVVGYQLWYRWREAAALHRLDSLAGLCRPSLLRRLVGSTAFWLVALCATGALLPAAAATRLAVQPDALGAGRGLWTLVTASFVHASLTHVLIVGILLGYLASALELHLGRAGLFAVFVGGGAAGSVAHVAFGGAAPLFGAMSGVAAMGGCLVALAPRRETRVAIPGGGAVALPAIIGIPLSLGLYGLIIAMGAFDLPCTPWLAQAVGFAAGVIVGLLVRAHRSLAALAVRPVRA